jgi:hypothetical protein
VLSATRSGSDHCKRKDTKMNNTTNISKILHTDPLCPEALDFTVKSLVEMVRDQGDKIEAMEKELRQLRAIAAQKAAVPSLTLRPGQQLCEKHGPQSFGRHGCPACYCQSIRNKSNA